MLLRRRPLIELGHHLHNKDIRCVAFQNSEGMGHGDYDLRCSWELSSLIAFQPLASLFAQLPLLL